MEKSDTAAETCKNVGSNTRSVCDDVKAVRTGVQTRFPLMSQSTNSNVSHLFISSVSVLFLYLLKWSFYTAQEKLIRIIAFLPKHLILFRLLMTCSFPDYAVNSNDVLTP